MIEGRPGISDGLTYSWSEPVAAGVFCAAFDAWWRRPSASRFPFAESIAAFQAAGKHFVAPEVITRLVRARHDLQRIQATDRERDRLRRFLCTALDKTDGCYDYASYCALPMLDLPEGPRTDLTVARIRRQRDVTLLGLMGDLLRFELRARDGRERRLPGLRPDADRATTRLRIILAVIRPSLQRMGIALAAETDTTRDSVERVLDAIAARIDPETSDRIALSLLPVHTVHDEVMFLRTLQTFEVNFAWIAVHMRNAVALVESDPESAPERLDEAREILRETLRLMPLIGSMQPEAFHDFRRFTEGASAIQSTGYKTVEALCARPAEDRVNSPAYRSVPGVQSEVRAGMPTLEEAVGTARAAGCLTPATDADLAAGMAEFSDLLLKWRRAHFEIARRVLGGLEGTGYTEGVPYLDRVRDLPVFPRIGPEPG